MVILEEGPELLLKDAYVCFPVSGPSCVQPNPPGFLRVANAASG